MSWPSALLGAVLGAVGGAALTGHLGMSDRAAAGVDVYLGTEDCEVRVLREVEQHRESINKFQDKTR